LTSITIGMSGDVGAPDGRRPRDVDTSELRYGSDFVAGFPRNYGFECAAFDPGSSFRGIEEPIVDDNGEMSQWSRRPTRGSRSPSRTATPRRPATPRSPPQRRREVPRHDGVFNACCDRVPVVALDHGIQGDERAAPMTLPEFEKHRIPSRFTPDPTAVGRAANVLVEADLPVILADQVGDARAAVDALVDVVCQPR
jgi:hypothetical protein